MNYGVEALFEIADEYLNYYLEEPAYTFGSFYLDFARIWKTRFKYCSEEIKATNKVLSGILDAIKIHHNGEHQINRQLVYDVMNSYMSDPDGFNFEKAIEGIQATS